MPTNESEEPENLKVVVVGDGMVGKTCLCLTYRDGKFPFQYSPTIFEGYLVRLRLSDRQAFNLHVVDTAGQEGYENLRQVAYPGTDVFILCFSCVRPQSFDNVVSVW